MRSEDVDVLAKMRAGGGAWARAVHMTVAAIDPGYRESALVVWDGAVRLHVKEANDAILQRIVSGSVQANVLVCEQMQMFAGRQVGVEVFDAQWWSGRFAQAWAPRPVDRLLRSKVRGHFGAIKGGDAAVRQALITRFGPYKDDAIGTAANPGPLHGIKADEWSALAIALCWWDLDKFKTAGLGM